MYIYIYTLYIYTCVRFVSFSGICCRIPGFEQTLRKHLGPVSFGTLWVAVKAGEVVKVGSKASSDLERVPMGSIVLIGNGIPSCTLAQDKNKLPPVLTFR